MKKAKFNAAESFLWIGPALAVTGALTFQACLWSHHEDTDSRLTGTLEVLRYERATCWFYIQAKHTVWEWLQIASNCNRRRLVYLFGPGSHPRKTSVCSLSSAAKVLNNNKILQYWLYFKQWPQKAYWNRNLKNHSDSALIQTIANTECPINMFLAKYTTDTPPHEPCLSVYRNRQNCQSRVFHNL